MYPIGSILRHHGIDDYIYADDTQLYIKFDLSEPSIALEKSNLCISDIRTWMTKNKLKINDISSNVDPLSYVDMCIECITDPLVTVDDVMTVISQLNNSAAGHDGLPASIMKKLSNDYAIPLTHCINMSVIQGD